MVIGMRGLLIAALCALTSPALAASVTVDLTTWTDEGGSWSLTNGNGTAQRSGNSATGVFHSGQNDLGARYTGTMRVNSTDDDDFIGFVFGYLPGDLDVPGDSMGPNGSIDYLLVDWKQKTQNGGAVGMALSRVTGDVYSTGGGNPALNSNAWNHSGNMQELARANTLGSTGWADLQDYSFTAEYLPNLLRLSIDGTVQFELTAADLGLSEFKDGSFGFYSFSQRDAQFSNLSYESPVAVPLPAQLPLALTALAALVALRIRLGRQRA